MFDFYVQPEWVRVMASMLVAVCTIVQTVSVVYTFNVNIKKDAMQKLQIGNELAVLAMLFYMVYMIAKVQLGASDGMILPQEKGYIQVMILAMICFFGAALSIFGRNIVHITGVLPASILLLLPKEAAAGIYAYLYLAVTIYFLFRSVCLIYKNDKIIKAKLSAYSVKYAIDALDAGILFYDPSGYITLMNTTMQNMIQKLCGKKYYNAHTFYEDITALRLSDKSEKISEDEKLLFRLSDGSIWLITQSELKINNKSYTQLLAFDVSREWELTEKLVIQKERPSIQSDELKAMLSEIREICIREETFKLRNRLHDCLGHNLALMLRELREGGDERYTNIASLAEGAIKELDHPFKVKDASQRLNALIAAMNKIGVELLIEGELIADEKIMGIFTDVIIEGTTNAIRHGFADKVFVIIRETKNEYCMKISDNGNFSGGDYKEGGGITAMRYKLSAIGGVIKIQTTQGFVIEISVAKDREDA